MAISPEDFTIETFRELKGFSGNIHRLLGKDAIQLKLYYEGTVTQIDLFVNNCEFWNEFKKKYTNYDSIYLEKFGSQLWARDQERPQSLNKKTYDSFINKLFRLSILEKKINDIETLKQYLSINHWPSIINDHVRTQLIVKFLDGSIYLEEVLSNLASYYNLKFKSEFKSKERGYHAIHCYVDIPMSLSDINYSPASHIISFEIQISTQLQEMIYQITHPFYETQRVELTNQKEMPWQWDYDKQEFAVGHIGHIIQYLEGTLVNMRNTHLK